MIGQGGAPMPRKVRKAREVCNLRTRSASSTAPIHYKPETLLHHYLSTAVQYLRLTRPPDTFPVQPLLLRLTVTISPKALLPHTITTFPRPPRAFSTCRDWRSASPASDGSQRTLTQASPSLPSHWSAQTLPTPLDSISRLSCILAALICPKPSHLGCALVQDVESVLTD